MHPGVPQQPHVVAVSVACLRRCQVTIALCCSDEWRTIVDTTGVRAAYKHINFRVSQTRELIFLAQVSTP